MRDDGMTRKLGYAMSLVKRQFGGNSHYVLGEMRREKRCGGAVVVGDTIFLVSKNCSEAGSVVAEPCGAGSTASLLASWRFTFLYLMIPL
jgi:hypothetical protein